MLTTSQELQLLKVAQRVQLEEEGLSSKQVARLQFIKWLNERSSLEGW